MSKKGWDIPRRRSDPNRWARASLAVTSAAQRADLRRTRGLVRGRNSRRVRAGAPAAVASRHIISRAGSPPCARTPSRGESRGPVTARPSRARVTRCSTQHIAPLKAPRYDARLPTLEQDLSRPSAPDGEQAEHQAAADVDDAPGEHRLARRRLRATGGSGPRRRRTLLVAGDSRQLGPGSAGGRNRRGRGRPVLS